MRLWNIQKYSSYPQILKWPYFRSRLIAVLINKPGADAPEPAFERFRWRWADITTFVVLFQSWNLHVNLVTWRVCQILQRTRLGLDVQVQRSFPAWFQSEKRRVTFVQILHQDLVERDWFSHGWFWFIKVQTTVYKITSTVQLCE